MELQKRAKQMVKQTKGARKSVGNGGAEPNKGMSTGRAQEGATRGVIKKNLKGPYAK